MNPKWLPTDKATRLVEISITMTMSKRKTMCMRTPERTTMGRSMKKRRLIIDSIRLLLINRYHLLILILTVHRWCPWWWYLYLTIPWWCQAWWGPCHSLNFSEQTSPKSNKNLTISSLTKGTKVCLNRHSKRDTSNPKVSTIPMSEVDSRSCIRIQKKRMSMRLSGRILLPSQKLIGIKLVAMSSSEFRQCQNFNWRR